MSEKNHIRVRWTNGCFWPVGRSQIEKCQSLNEGEQLGITIERVRSGASHRQYFAELGELWQNLPEAVHGEPWAATSETMRKHALIMTGWVEQSLYTFEDPKIALAVCPHVQKAERALHGYAIVTVDDCNVVVNLPASQNMASMGRQAFERSKHNVITWCKETIGAVYDRAAAG